MNILVDDLDVILKERIGNIKFNTNFRISIMFELLMQDKNINKKNKVITALNLYYEDLSQITDINKAIEDILWFYKCGKEELANSKKETNNIKNKQIYSYEFDDMYIYSAFLEQYNIDLQDIDYLHWWKFKSLFEGMNEKTKIVEIMGYRALDLRSIKDKKEKARIKRLKEIYRLPDMRTKEQKESDFNSIFW